MPDPSELSTTTQVKSAVFDYHYVRRDCWGRIVIDQCSSDHEHLVNPTTCNYERPTCRHLLEQLIPDTWLEKRGRISVAITFTEAA